MRPKVLLIEDDEMLNAGICYHLQNCDYEVKPMFTYSEAKTEVLNNNWQLFIVDINLPDGNGIELCKFINKHTSSPVIFLTANDLEENILEGFDAGASDYITKPFSIPVLLRRVRAVLKRNTVIPNSIIRCGNLMIDLAKGQVEKSGETLRLTQNEWKLISLFIDNPGQLLTRNQILQILWDSDGNFVSAHTLTTLVSRLRSKLSDTEYQYIKTYYGIGYRWVGEKDDE
ncbi:response regulator transcription factor [Proteiniborus sp. MB09-C3]|uniref:response regulator transcription factor n=1 Tax=Proteiniborus sp. MB09-C3 TaxID=3050072 RepID=UPI002553F776|nr:response regulator transcription factor [Proteiniborus sp. MB09-C3]WIV12436.1 response regulator transcription factor [Proteiniborus sp. MB09-C3]